MTTYRGGYYGKDDHEAIKQCLSCVKPSCTNCLEWQSKGQRREKRERKSVDEALYDPARRTKD